MAKNLLWLNGRISSIEEGRVSVEDRGLNFSDGIYEVAVYYNGRPFMAREHLERWHFSAEGLMMKAPGTIDERLETLQELVDESGHPSAMVYGQLTRGTAPRNHLFPSPPVEPTEFWFVKPAPRHSPELRANGAKLVTHPDERWVHCQYKTVSLLPNVLAKERAHRQGGYEALLWLPDGTVTECTSANAYCVRGGVVYTHPRTPRILGGITRLAILALAKSLGLEVREQSQTLEQFRRADEVFISSTTMEVMPATRIDDGAVGNGKVGPITNALAAGLRERIAEECGTVDVRK